ncbi:hypothetical protein GCM10010191_10300 [Actinomadura vinacea]|uniref:Uncharacterized protein n=2 Tax=Actinomadura vinacea TaxID=115336 RepID=A0ABN3IH43_9ACTN
MDKRPLTALAFGALAGAVIGGFIAGLNYMVWLADLQHRDNITLFTGEVEYLYHVGKAAAVGAAYGVFGGLYGAIGGVLGGFGSAKARMVTVGILGAAVMAAVSAFVVFFVLSGFRVVDVVINGYLGVAIFTMCGWAAGVVVSAHVADTDQPRPRLRRRWGVRTALRVARSRSKGARDA